MIKKWKETIGILAIAGLLCASVIYVAASEISIEPARETASWTSKEQQESQETKRTIRMANEDGILVSAMAISPQYFLSEREYGILARIVEAEATGKDIKSKILVANVVLNRMKNEEFPDTVEGVVFQRVAGVVQFSPIADGRYYRVTVTDETKESVDRALLGEDYSEGALYFMERSMSDQNSVAWFDRELTWLFKYQGHEFYR